jgi:hypothetical protein
MTFAELQAKADALIAENQKLGAEIDALRDRRRAINQEVAQLHATMRTIGALGVSAAAPGAEVDVSARELLQGMLAALPGTKQ